MAAMNTVHVDQGNVEQLRAWDGDEGAYWAAHPDRFDRSIAVHHAPFMRSAGIALGETVLDVGCGAGQTTIEAANANGGAAALGVDLSAALLDVARRRAASAGAANARFLQADAQIHRFEPHSIDVVLARTSAMFFGDHSAAFANLRSATRDGGRIVLLTWQPLEHNEWLAEIAGALTVDGTPRLPPPGVGPFSLAVTGAARSASGRRRVRAGRAVRVHRADGLRVRPRRRRLVHPRLDGLDARGPRRRPAPRRDRGATSHVLAASDERRDRVRLRRLDHDGDRRVGRKRSPGTLTGALVRAGQRTTTCC